MKAIWIVETADRVEVARFPWKERGQAEALRRRLTGQAHGRAHLVTPGREGTRESAVPPDRVLSDGTRIIGGEVLPPVRGGVVVPTATPQHQESLPTGLIYCPECGQVFPNRRCARCRWDCEHDSYPLVISGPARMVLSDGREV